jgi:hypothetical protein
MSEDIVDRVWLGCSIATSITVAVSVAVAVAVGYAARELMVAASLI